jgi:hypothetical protein
LVYAVARAEELAERRRAHGGNHAGLEVEKHRAGHVLAARGFVVKRADAAELRVVIAAVIDAAADTVLVAHHPESGLVKQPRLELRLVAQKSRPPCHCRLCAVSLLTFFVNWE